MTTSRRTPLERWVAIGVRTVHLAGVVGVGAAVVAGQAPSPAVVWLMASSGGVLLAMDVYAGRIALGELAGVFVLAKMALVVWMAMAPHQAMWLFWALLAASSVMAHAPKAFRHWRWRATSTPSLRP